jgi:hypothetical protein
LSCPFELGLSFKTLAVANGRVKELADRYAAPPRELTTCVAEFEAKLAAHRAKMGRY